MAGRTASAERGAVRGMSRRNAYYIYVYKGVGRIAVSVGALFGVLFRVLDLALLHDFLLLDETSAAVLAAVSAFFARCAAAGTCIVILDHCTDDLFFRTAVGSEAHTMSQEPYELDDQHDGNHNSYSRCHQSDYAADDLPGGSVVFIFILIGVVFRFLIDLSLGGEAEGIIRICDAYSVSVAG